MITFNTIPSHTLESLLFEDDKNNPLNKYDVREEHMVYSGSVEFVKGLNSPITRHVLSTIINDPLYQTLAPAHQSAGFTPIIDTRFALLMPGMSLAIPGWHCDDVPRHYTVQPDLNWLNQAVSHFTCQLGGESTKYLSDIIHIPVKDIDEANVWSSVNKFINKQDNLVIDTYPENTVTVFNRDRLHDAPTATNRQWRYWFRLSFMKGKPHNEIRKHVQVYTTTTGW